MIVRGAKVFDEKNGFIERDVFIDGASFADAAGGESIDGSGCYAIPGLIDVHLHGCVGREFSDADAAGIDAMADYQASQGVTAICPTTLTDSEEALAKACGEIARASSEKGAAIVGVNLEGPFMSPHKLGAQNGAYLKKPDAAMFRRLQKAAGGLVRLLAIAPELPGAMQLIEELSGRSGEPGEVVCSVAHTTADYALAMEAFEKGARHVTHLYNAMPPFAHREPSVVGAAFDWPSCRVELICDDVHIHPSVVRATFKMFGDDRIVMISDSMMATGLDDGEYRLGRLPVRVCGNKATLIEGGNIAGSVTNLMKCLKTAVSVMGIPLHSAVKCAAVNPAKTVGVFGERGSIEAGKCADLVLLDANLDVKKIIMRGKTLYS